MFRFLFLLFVSLSMSVQAGADDARLCILQLQGTANLKTQSASLMKSISDECIRTGACVVPEESSAYHYPANVVLSRKQINAFKSIADRFNCSHLLMGRIIKRQKAIIIENRIFNKNDGSIMYSSSSTYSGEEDPASAAKYIVGRSILVVTNKLPKVLELSASRGTDDRCVSLKWSENSPGSRYSVYRKTGLQNPYEFLDTTGDTDFCDNRADAGIKYFYRIVPHSGQVQGEPETTWGYIKPKNPRGLKTDEIVDSKIREKEIPATPSELAKQRRELKLMEEYYESYFMMTFIFLVGKMYVNRGDLIVYRDFDRYTLDRPNKTAYFYKSDVIIRFRSERFFRFVRDIGWQSIQEHELLSRLAHNGVAFCVRTGEVESTGPDGITRFIPTFEAAGFATEYFRDYRDWKSNSVIFATNDKELDKKIKDAKKRGY